MEAGQVHARLRRPGRHSGDEVERLDTWLAWTCRCRIKPFVKLARTIRQYRPPIEATLRHGLRNVLVEGRNTPLRLFHRIAYGFHDVDALVELATLKLVGLCPALPGRL